MKSFKIGAVALIAATVFGVSCQKQTIDINTTLPDNQITINVPATDLSGIEATLQAILDKINGKQYDQLQTLIDQLTKENAELGTQLQAIVDQLKADKTADAAAYAALQAQLKDILTAIQALQSTLTQKIDALSTAINTNDADIVKAIKDAQAAITSADEASLQAIIDAMNSNYTDVLEKLQEAVDKLDNEEIKEKLDTIIVLIAAHDIDFAEFREDMAELMDMIAKQLNIMEDVTATYSEIKDLPFEAEDVPEIKSDVVDGAEDADATVKDGVVYAAVTVNVPVKGAVMFSDEQIAAFKAQLDSIQTKAEDGDLIQAREAIRLKIDDLSRVWSETTPKTFEVSVAVDDKVTSATATIDYTVNVNIVPCSIYTVVNDKYYYIIGTKTVADDYSDPTFEITTTEGTTTHAGTLHTGHTGHTGHSGHDVHGDDNNAGGGIVTK